MKPGTVARIRVNPKDCIGIIDMLKAAGINTEHKSFAACTSLALSAMLDIMRKNQIIPDGDGFDYLEKMQQTKDDRTKMQEAYSSVDLSAPAMSIVEAQQHLKTLEEKRQEESLTMEEEQLYNRCMKIVYGE